MRVTRDLTPDEAAAFWAEVFRDDELAACARVEDESHSLPTRETDAVAGGPPLPRLLAMAAVNANQAILAEAGEAADACCPEQRDMSALAIHYDPAVTMTRDHDGRVSVRYRCAVVKA